MSFSAIRSRLSHPLDGVKKSDDRKQKLAENDFSNHSCQVTRQYGDTPRRASRPDCSLERMVEEKNDIVIKAVLKQSSVTGKSLHQTLLDTQAVNKAYGDLYGCLPEYGAHHLFTEKTSGRDYSVSSEVCNEISQTFHRMAREAGEAASESLRQPDIHFLSKPMRMSIKMLEETLRLHQLYERGKQYTASERLSA
jgi:hypothetical protein